MRSISPFKSIPIWWFRDWARSSNPFQPLCRTTDGSHRYSIPHWIPFCGLWMPRHLKAQLQPRPCRCRLPTWAARWERRWVPWLDIWGRPFPAWPQCYSHCWCLCRWPCPPASWRAGLLTSYHPATVQSFQFSSKIFIKPGRDSCADKYISCS